MPNYLDNNCKFSELQKTFEKRGSVTFEYCGKKIQLYSYTTLTELQEEFGNELDMIDIFRANWSINNN